MEVLAMINENALLDILKSWKKEADNKKYAGLKEDASYQRVIDLVEGMADENAKNEKMSANQRIKDRIAAAAATS